MFLLNNARSTGELGEIEKGTVDSQPNLTGMGRMDWNKMFIVLPTKHVVITFIDIYLQTVARMPVPDLETIIESNAESA